MWRSIVGCIAVLLFAQAGGETEESKAARKSITAVLAEQVEAWNKGDLKGFMEGYLRSDELTFYSGNSVLKGWDATFERYKKRYQGEGNEMGKLAFRDLDIQILGPEIAVVRGRFELSRRKDAPTGLFTLVFRKTAGGWRIIHDHTST
jgi:uncharacterized protein (TIGR02246 family)